MSDLPSIQDTVSCVLRGDATASEIAYTAIKRIRSHALPTNAFITLLNDPDTTNTGNGGELEGAVFAVKDNINLRGERSTCGSKILRDYIAHSDAEVVTLLKRAGAICIGKNNMHEFALGATNLNPHFGDVCNPWDLSRIAGGSSGGSAASVASGEVHFALGTDSGGSVRIPASFCGVVGFKPTGNQVSLRGIEGAAWTIDNIGVFARNVRDVQIVWKQLESKASSVTSSPREYRLAYLCDESMGKVAPDVWAVYMEAIERLKATEYDLQGISLRGFEKSPFVCVAIAYPEVSSSHTRWIRERPGDYGDDIRPLIQLGEILGARHYVAAQRARSALLRSYLQQTGEFDAVITPTTAVAPPRRGGPVIIPGDESRHTLFTLVRFTVLFNVIGFPAVSLPIGLNRDALPVGLQVVGHPRGDTVLLEIARKLEGALGLLGAPPVRVNC